jgi:hypothetical protein
MVEFKIRDAIAPPTIARSAELIMHSLVRRQLLFCCDRDEDATDGQQADNDSDLKRPPDSGQSFIWLS